jgi:hypothetical protein
MRFSFIRTFFASAPTQLAWCALICAYPVDSGPALQHEPLAPPLARPVVAEGTQDNDLVWRTARACPINSLYIFLRLHDVDASYSQIAQELPLTKEGSSLINLRDYAARCGIAARVIRSSPELLSVQNLPVIAHLEESTSTSGHYIIVTGATSNVVEYIDGTTATIDTMPMSSFAKFWTGYLLISNRPTSQLDRFRPLLLMLSGVFVAAIIGLLWKRKRLDLRSSVAR